MTRTRSHLARAEFGTRVVTRAGHATSPRAPLGNRVFFGEGDSAGEKLDINMLTSWGGVFPPMHPVHAVEDGEHKRKREDELDLSIREGAEGEYASPQNRALAQRRRRFAKSHR